MSQFATSDAALRVARRTIISLLLLASVASGHAEEGDDDFVKLRSELQLIQWDLEDECSTMARNERGFYAREATALRDKIIGEVDRANFLRAHAARLKAHESVPYDLLRNWTHLTKCGDVLLAEDEYKAFVVFACKNLELKLVDAIEALDEKQARTLLGEGGVSQALATRRNASQLEEVWRRWAAGTKPFQQWYHSALQMVNRAALANGFTEVETYWEMLSDMPSGYELSQRLFEELQPLYGKLHLFVRLRLNKHYNRTYEESFPTYLTGSFLGDDWSNIADILLPNPQLYHDVKAELAARTIQDFYKYASNATKNLGLGEIVTPSFLARSEFNARTCDTKTFDYCEEQYSSVFTCNRTSLSTYLDAHETVMQLALTKANFHAKSTEGLRFSPVADGVQALASLLGVNGMLRNGIAGATAFDDHTTREDNRMTVLLLLALRVLPKIAYYHAMDAFRMDLLANHGVAEEVYRKHVKHVQGLDVATGVAAFLRDERILFNRPYLSKMLGSFLQFHLLDHYQIDLFADADATTLLNADGTFRDLVHDLPNRDSQDLLGYYYNLDEIAEYPLVAFFAPLEQYLDDAPLEQATFRTRTPAPAPQAAEARTTAGDMRSNVKLDARNSDGATKEQHSDDSGGDGGANPDGEDAALGEGMVDAAPKQAPVHLGVYVGAGIVAVTLAIIVGGFVAQRRRTQRNHRRYNA